MRTDAGLVKVPRIHKVGNLSSAYRNIGTPTNKGRNGAATIDEYRLGATQSAGLDSMHMN